MTTTSLRNCTQYLATLAGSPRRAVRHDALGGRNYRYTQPAQHFGQIILALVDPQSGPAYALHMINDRLVFAILQTDLQAARNTAPLDEILRDIAAFAGVLRDEGYIAEYFVEGSGVHSVL